MTRPCPHPSEFFNLNQETSYKDGIKFEYAKVLNKVCQREGKYRIEFQTILECELNCHQDQALKSYLLDKHKQSYLPGFKPFYSKNELFSKFTSRELGGFIGKTKIM